MRVPDSRKVCCGYYAPWLCILPCVGDGRQRDGDGGAALAAYRRRRAVKRCCCFLFLCVLLAYFSCLAMRVSTLATDRPMWGRRPTDDRFILFFAKPVRISITLQLRWSIYEEVSRRWWKGRACKNFLAAAIAAAPNDCCCRRILSIYPYVVRSVGL